MAGNSEGARKGRDTKIKKWGPDYFKRLGSQGGKTSRGGGFASQKKGKDGLTGSERLRKIWEKRKQEEDNADNETSG